MANDNEEKEVIEITPLEILTLDERMRYLKELDREIDERMFEDLH